jgi:sugar (pentulose or hexulose) kinase
MHTSVAKAVDAFVAYQPEEQLPDLERHEIYAEAYRRYRDVYFALKPVFERT